MRHGSHVSFIRYAIPLVGTLLTGCVSVSVPDLPAQAPAAWSQPAGQGARPVDLRSWWKSLDDPRLDGLVQEALRQNLDIEQSVRLLEGEQLLVKRSQSRFLPALSAGARPMQDAAANDAYFHVSLDMAWEFGLFGAARSAQLQADAGLDRAEARVQGLRVAVIAAVARNYLDLGVANGQIAYLEKMSALAQQGEYLAQVRLNARLGTPQEVEAASVKHQRSLGALAAMRLTADRAARALALLLGRNAPDPAWRTVPPPRGLPSFSTQEVPADLLRTRPDIREAEADVLQAAARLGMARSALYPRLSLNGSILYSYNFTQNRRSNNNFVPAFGPAIDVPLLDWGARRAQAYASERGMDAALLGYRKAVLAGVSEVEGALSTLSREQERIEALDEVRRVLQRRADAQRRLTPLGLSSDFDALDGQRALLEAESELAMAQGARTLAFVALYKALGGAPLADTALAQAQP